MEQNWKGKFKVEILEDIKKEAIREWTEEKAKILMDENWDDDKIAEILALDIGKVQRIREDHQKLEFAKQLMITRGSFPLILFYIFLPTLFSSFLHSSLLSKSI